MARADDNSGGSTEDIFLADFQKKLAATYKSPVAIGSAQITLGLGYAFGRQKSDQFITIDDVLRPEDLLDDEKETTAHFSRLKFIIGFGVRT